jgi:hypothetical protein
MSVQILACKDQKFPIDVKRVKCMASPRTCEGVSFRSLNLKSVIQVLKLCLGLIFIQMDSDLYPQA